VPDFASTPTGLLVPPSAIDRRKVYGCTVCGRRFPGNQRQQWARHVSACAKKNEDKLERAVHLKREADHVLGIGDDEKHRWVRKRKAEGRLRKADTYDSK
jgi:hypothetical protein